MFIYLCELDEKLTMHDGIRSAVVIARNDIEALKLVTEGPVEKLGGKHYTTELGGISIETWMANTKVTEIGRAYTDTDDSPRVVCVDFWHA